MTGIKTLHPRHRHIWLIICVLFLSACANTNGPIRLYAGPQKSKNEIVTFRVPYELEVVAIDGRKLKMPYVPEGQYQFELLPGNHVLKVIYTAYWGDDTSGNVVVSDAFYFRVATTAGSSYVFKHNGPTDLVYASFDSQISDIRIWLVQQKTGQTINAISTRAYGNYLTRALRHVVSGTEEGKPVAIQEEGAKITVPTSSISPPVTLSSTAKQTNASALIAEQIIARQNALDRLKFWWKMANEKQRKAFQVWTDRPVTQSGQK
ncbi:MAG TPA: DUF2057 domain-containing protein [Gammaproteobacteria bacterium]|nr:DUF2057 domain-containing protein [Gammaproteobacteria bacterium]